MIPFQYPNPQQLNIALDILILFSYPSSIAVMRVHCSTKNTAQVL